MRSDSLASGSRLESWRIDAVNNRPSFAAYDRGYERTLDELFERTGNLIGKGGFGVVTVVIERNTGQQYACKTIRKHLNVPNIAPVKIQQHLSNIDREVKVLKLLRGTLSVVNLKGVFEDDESVHIVMEYCKGGELYANLSKHGALTEAKVATSMRSVLQTLAQCHSHRILHRDIKPGNFLLLNEDENSPLKAVDFGMAVIWERDEQLPRTDLGLDGTPWFMAPEVISESETYPASDIWSAGVMCYQLLSGKLPFDDTKNRQQPSLSLVWRSILTEEVSFARREWETVSDEAKRFVMSLLNKDPKERPTASEALRDPWLHSAFHADRSDRIETLDSTVVQRLQRFAQANLLQRTILELVASELVKVMPAGWLPDETVRVGGGIGGGACVGAGGGLGRKPETPQSGGDAGTPGLERRDSKVDDLVFPMSPEVTGGMGTSGLLPLSSGASVVPVGTTTATEQKRGPTPSTPARGIAQPIKQLTPVSLKGSKGQSYDWKAMRRASDLVLQGSGHRQSSYLHACSGLDQEERLEQRKAARLSLDTSSHGNNNFSSLTASRYSPGSFKSPFVPGGGQQQQHESRRKTSRHSAEFLFPADDMDDASPTLTPPPSLSTTPGSSRGQSLEKSLEKGGRGRSLALEALQSNSSSSNKVTNPISVGPLMKKVGFRRGKVMTKNSLMSGLSQLGYSVEEDELSTLMDRVGLQDDSDGIKETVCVGLGWGSRGRAATHTLS